VRATHPHPPPSDRFPPHQAYLAAAPAGGDPTATAPPTAAEREAELACIVGPGATPRQLRDLLQRHGNSVNRAADAWFRTSPAAEGEQAAAAGAAAAAGGSEGPSAVAPRRGRDHRGKRERDAAAAAAAEAAGGTRAAAAASPGNGVIVISSSDDEAPPPLPSRQRNGCSSDGPRPSSAAPVASAAIAAAAAALAAAAVQMEEEELELGPDEMDSDCSDLESEGSDPSDEWDAPPEDPQATAAPKPPPGPGLGQLARGVLNSDLVFGAAYRQRMAGGRLPARLPFPQLR